MKKILFFICLLFVSNVFAYMGDGMGNHKARKNIDMNGFSFDNSPQINKYSTSTVTLDGNQTILSNKTWVTGTSVTVCGSLQVDNFYGDGRYITNISTNGFAIKEDVRVATDTLDSIMFKKDGSVLATGDFDLATRNLTNISSLSGAYGSLILLTSLFSSDGINISLSNTSKIVGHGAGYGMGDVGNTGDIFSQQSTSSAWVSPNNFIGANISTGIVTIDGNQNILSNKTFKSSVTFEAVEITSANITKDMTIQSNVIVHGCNATLCIGTITNTMNGQPIVVSTGIRFISQIGTNIPNLLDFRTVNTNSTDYVMIGTNYSLTGQGGITANNLVLSNNSLQGSFNGTLSIGANCGSNRIDLLTNTLNRFSVLSNGSLLFGNGVNISTHTAGSGFYLSSTTPLYTAPTQTVPTSGFTQGALIYNRGDNHLYVSTENVSTIASFSKVLLQTDSTSGTSGGIKWSMHLYPKSADIGTTGSALVTRREYYSAVHTSSRPYFCAEIPIASTNRLFYTKTIDGQYAGGNCTFNVAYMSTGAVLSGTIISTVSITQIALGDSVEKEGGTVYTCNAHTVGTALTLSTFTATLTTPFSAGKLYEIVVSFGGTHTNSVYILDVWFEE